MYDSPNIMDKNREEDEYSVVRVQNIHILCEVGEYYLVVDCVQLKVHIVKPRVTTKY